MTENASVHSGLISIIKHKMFQIFISIVIALLLIASLVVPGLAQASGEDNITLSTDKLSLTGGRVELEGLGFTQISAGNSHSLALDQNGNIYSWGRNNYGHLGNGTTTDSNTPVQVKTTGTPMEGKKIVQISTGIDHSLALDQDGNVYSWGRNNYGQLGNGVTTDEKTTYPVSTLLNSLPNITVGGVPATNISRGLNGKLSFTAPPHDTGPYDVVITYPYANRSYTLAGGLTYINTNPGGSNPSPSESEAGGDSNSNVNNNIDNDNPGAPNAGFGEE